MSWKILGLTMLVDAVVACLAKYRASLTRRKQQKEDNKKLSTQWDLFPYKFDSLKTKANKGEVIPPKVKLPRSRVK